MPRGRQPATRRYTRPIGELEPHNLRHRLEGDREAPATGEAGEEPMIVVDLEDGDLD